MNKLKILGRLAKFCIPILIATCFSLSAYAGGKLSEGYVDSFAQNDITFYDPDECSSSGTSVSVCGVTLPAETIAQLESAGVKEKAEENMERYKYAEEQTGVPWQAIAALHYREGGMASDASISNGQKLTSDGSCYTNVDGLSICSDANEDAKEAAEHLIEMGKSVYGVDITTETSTEAFGKAFLAYNRGYMYVNGGAEWDTSPYVMNGFDSDHMNMVWQHADSWNGSTQLNSVEGKQDSNAGALAVFAYLCGSSNSSDSSSSSSSSSSDLGSSGSSVSGSQITWIGDSYSVGAYSIIEEQFSGVDVGDGTNTASSYIQSSKFVSSGSDSNPSCLSILEDLVNSGGVRQYIVLACGTNGGWTSSDIAKFEELLAKTSSKAVVVTSKIPSNDYSASNALLQDLASSNDNVFLADWSAVYNEEYFAGDPEKIHPVTNPGYEKWVGVISNALSSASGDSCTTYTGEYPEYPQCDGDWSGVAYGDGKTICSSGCGAASMAMLATVAAGKDIYPQDIAELLGDSYYWATTGVGMAELDKKVGEHYGFEVVTVEYSSLEDAVSKMREYLEQGYMLHFSGAGSAPFSSGGHYVGIYKMDDDGTVYTANSAIDGNSTYKLEDVVYAGMHGGAFSAIKGSGGSGTCSGLCESSSLGALNGGLTDEQAQALADYYNGPNVSASTLIGGLKENCVSFSCWFIDEFVDTDWGCHGNGKEVALNLASEAGFESGTEARPYAVFGVPKGVTMCGTSLCGHTGIVVAVNGDDITTVEAAYKSHNAKVVHRDISYFTEGVGGINPFTYTDGYLDETKLAEIIGD